MGRFFAAGNGGRRIWYNTDTIGNEEDGMKTLIFGMDGVLVSGALYGDVSSLAIWEILYGRDYMGLPSERRDFSAGSVNDGQLAAIRALVWHGDRLLSVLSARGVLSYADRVHAFLVTAFGLMGEEYRRRTGGDCLSFSLEEAADVKAAGRLLMGLPVPGAQDVLAAWKRAVPEEASGTAFFAGLAAWLGGVFGDVPAWAAQQSAFYRMEEEALDSWYLGDDLFIRRYRRMPQSGGKAGFWRQERALVPQREAAALFAKLRDRGYALAAASGRLAGGVEVPLAAFGWSPYFSMRSADFSDLRGGEGNLWMIGRTFEERLLADRAGARFIRISAGEDTPAEAARWQGVPSAARVTDILRVLP